MNQQQTVFMRRALQQLTRVIADCNRNSSTATAVLGRKSIGKYVVLVSIIAEVDQGFSAPLSSHASRLGAKPDYSLNTRHRVKQRATRWHKPFFDEQ